MLCRTPSLSLSPIRRVYTEILQQLHVVNNFSQDFQGRTDILERVRNYTQGSSKQPLVLWGEGGCGKSSMLAKIAAESPTWLSSRPCTPIRLVRFLGTTPDSSSIGPLLRSVCQQISLLYQIQDSTIPVELSQVTNHFKRLLEKTTADRPLCIFFDSLDQLSSAEGAHSMSWLPPTLPSHVKLVRRQRPHGSREVSKRPLSISGCFHSTGHLQYPEHATQHHR